MVQERSSSQSESQRVVLASPHALIREGIVRILLENGFQVVGQTGSTDALQQLVEQIAPDLILVDWELLEVDWEAILGLVDKQDHGAIVVLARPEASVGRLPVVGKRARGYLSMNLSPREFIQALRMVSKGGVVLSQGMADSVMSNFDIRQPLRTDKLSDREQEVLGLVTQGASNREIAEKLIVSENTVKVHLRSILNKLNLRNRQQVAAYAVQEGLVPETRFEDHQG